MHILLTRAAAVLTASAVLLSLAAPQAEARGCLKGALVGGVVGHFAGRHAALGAAAGCAVGHHEAYRNDRSRRDDNRRYDHR